jgi:hypothetical protein
MKKKHAKSQPLDLVIRRVRSGITAGYEAQNNEADGGNDGIGEPEDPHGGYLFRRVGSCSLYTMP